VSAVRAYPTTMSVEDFYAYPFPDGKVELVRGEPRVREPAGGRHGWVQSNLAALLIPFVNANALGKVFNDGVGFVLNALPRTVRNPDTSFVRAERLSGGDLPTRGFIAMAPDLAVEILSPDESASDLEEKLDDYRATGTPLIWVIDPDRRTVAIISDDEPARWLREGDTLDGGRVIEGFSCPVSSLFEGLS
jgi:Uma2 family endonuclease